MEWSSLRRWCFKVWRVKAKIEDFSNGKVVLKKLHSIEEAPSKALLLIIIACDCSQQFVSRRIVIDLERFLLPLLLRVDWKVQLRQIEDGTHGNIRKCSIRIRQKINKRPRRKSNWCAGKSKSGCHTRNTLQSSSLGGLFLDAAIRRFCGLSRGGLHWRFSPEDSPVKRSYISTRVG